MVQAEIPEDLKERYELAKEASIGGNQGLRALAQDQVNLIERIADSEQRCARLMREKEALSTSLKEKADRAYCDYIAQMQRPLCLGAEAKLKDSTFSLLELDAHTKAAVLLGRHQGFAEARAALAAESTKGESE